MPSRQTIAPASEPLSLIELKEFLRLEPDYTDEDNYLNIVVKSVRERCEIESGLQLLPATWVHYVEHFRTVHLPKHPVSAVTGITYEDENGDTQTLSTDLYRVDTVHTPARVIFDGNMPRLNDVEYPVQITYTAGFADADSIPAEAKYAMMLDAGSQYEHRNEVMLGSLAQIPRTALNIYRELRNQL